MIPTGNSVILPTGQVSTTVEYQGETTDPNSKLMRPQPSGSGITAGDTWCFSIFLKAGTEDTVCINMQNNTGTEGVRVNSFNMLTGENSSIIINGDATNSEFGAISYPNGWWRVYIRGTFANDASSMQTVIRLQGFSNQVSVTTSFSAWGAQLEKASFMTSYIPNNTGSQATRTPDSASMTGTNFSSWYNSTEGTLFASARINSLGGSTYPGIAYVDDGTIANCMGFYVNDVSIDNIGAEAYISNSVQYAFGSSSAIVPNQLNKVISAYKVNDFAIAFNVGGNTVRTDTAGSVPTVNRLIIGRLRGGYAPLNGTISQFSYYPKRLTNAQLQTLTQ